MSTQQQVEAIEAEAKSRLAYARQIVDTAAAEKRKLFDFEKADVDRTLESVDALNTKRKAIVASGKRASGIRNKLGTADGWKKASAAFVRGETKVEGELNDFLGKVVSFADPENRVELPGIAQLIEDERRLYSLFPSADPGNALTVNEFKQSGTRVLTGTVERALLATTDKASVDLTVTHVEPSIKQMAIMVKDLPNALLEAEPALNAFLAGQMQAELEKALDSHAITQLLAAGIQQQTETGDHVADIRKAVSKLQGLGANPTVVVVSATDAEAIDLQTTATRQLGFPFGLRWVVHPTVVDPLVMDPAGAILYRGRLALDRDPYRQFSKNESDLRAEFSALLHVREPKRFCQVGGGFTT